MFSEIITALIVVALIAYMIIGQCINCGNSFMVFGAVLVGFLVVVGTSYYIASHSKPSTMVQMYGGGKKRGRRKKHKGGEGEVGEGGQLMNTSLVTDIESDQGVAVGKANLLQEGEGEEVEEVEDVTEYTKAEDSAYDDMGKGKLTDNSTTPMSKATPWQHDPAEGHQHTRNSQHVDGGGRKYQIKAGSVLDNIRYINRY